MPSQVYISGIVAPCMNLYWADAVLPAMCSVVESTALVLSYQPREARFASSKFSWKRSVPPPGGGGGGGGGGGAVTVIADVPDLPEDVAVIVAEPAATPVTTPVEFTVAAAALFVDHVTV